jgi:hypothetical protein
MYFSFEDGEVYVKAAYIYLSIHIGLHPNYELFCLVLLLRTFRFHGFSLLDKATKITAIDFVEVPLGECSKIRPINFIQVFLLTVDS